MFDVSFTELMVIGVVALIVVGPERLPKVARTLGHLLGRAQRYVADVKSDIRREIELDELRRLKIEMDEAARAVHGGLSDAQASLRPSAEALRDGLDQTVREASAALPAPLQGNCNAAEAPIDQAPTATSDTGPRP